nr:retrovirus-related Pol polyprotein from transposon TNT 1-94 [Tanacetum cinerariifolium]
MALGYQNPFYLKQAQQKQQSLYNRKVLLEKHDPPVVYDSEETLQLAQEKAAKFVRDFKSLAKEADESLAKHKVLRYEIERLLKAVYKKCKECKYDKISYDKAYNDMQQRIQRFQDQLGDLKGKSKNTPCVSDTLDPLSHKLKDGNVELEFQVLNYAKENANLKTTYKNLFDYINVSQTQTKTIIDSLQEKLHNTIYENFKLRSQLSNKVSEQQDTKISTSVNTKFTKQPVLRKPHSSSRSKLYSVTPFLNLKVILKDKPELRPTKDFEAKYNKVKAKLALLSSSVLAFKAATIKNKGLIAKAYEWDKEEVSLNDNEMVEVKVLMALAKENDDVSKEDAKNGEWVKISMRKTLLSEVEGFILPNYDTGRILPTESQRNTIDPSVVVTDSSVTEYDSANESLVCSTPLPPLKKLDGVEPISEPKIIKSILRKPIWYLDSGCSRHMTGVKSYLHKYEEQPRPKVAFEDDSICTTEGYGSIKCNVYIHNHKDHLGKFDENDDDGFLLGYSLVSKALRVFNIRRYQTEETYHIIFDETPYAFKFSKPLVENINIAENKDIHLMNIFILMSLLKGVGILIRAMAKELGAASAYGCLFVYFLYEEEPKKDSEVLQHPG